MFKIGDKVLFREYKDMPSWKNGIYEIGEIKRIPSKRWHEEDKNEYSVKSKTKIANGQIIDLYSSTFHTEKELITIKELRRQKLEKINESSL